MILEEDTVALTEYRAWSRRPCLSDIQARDVRSWVMKR